MPSFYRTAYRRALSSGTLLLVIMLASLFSTMLASPGPTVAQCNYVNYNVGGPSAPLIGHVFSSLFFPTTTCTNIMSNNAMCGNGFTFAGGFNCPAGTMNCLVLVAQASMTMVSPTPHTCSANCGPCANVRIDNSDGLPVELMGFSVEGDEATDAENDESGTQDKNGSD